MADEKTTKEATVVTDKKKEVDLSGLLGWAQQKKEESKEKKSGDLWGIVIALISAAIVFIGMAFIAWWMWKKGEEVAKLKHKIDVDNEEKKRVIIKAELEKNEKDRKELEASALVLESKIESSKREILVLEDQRQKSLAAIDKITSWEDVDALLKK